MNIEIRKYNRQDVMMAIDIWNCVVEEGKAFPQLETLDEVSGDEFLKASHIRELLLILIKAKLWVFIFFTPTMWEDADIFAMQAMPYPEKAGAYILVKSW